MAIFRLSAQIVKRSDGRSATAAAAYRAGVTIPDARTGLVFDYTRRHGVTHTEILAPAGTPAAMLDRVALWNAVEVAEGRRDSQVAREIELALPHELQPQERLDLVRDFVTAEFVSLGMVADVAWHRPDRRGDQRNHHAHVMLSLRQVDAGGFGPKVRAWNDTALLEHWRVAWSDAVNQAFASHGHAARVDHRSYAERGLALEPEPKMGPTATAIERRGRVSRAGQDRRAVRARNRVRMEAIDELATITAELEALEGGAAIEVRELMSIGGGGTAAPFAPLPVIEAPAPSLRHRRPVAGWTRYLFAMWTTVARAVTTPFQALGQSLTKRQSRHLRH